MSSKNMFYGIAKRFWIYLISIPRRVIELDIYKWEFLILWFIAGKISDHVNQVNAQHPDKDMQE